MALATPSSWSHFYPVDEQDQNPSNTREEYVVIGHNLLQRYRQRFEIRPRCMGKHRFQEENEDSDLGSEDDEDWKEWDPDALFRTVFQMDQESYYDMPADWYHELIGYAKLPPKVWHRILSSLDFRDMCNMAMVCPFFYKIVGADFKRLCRQFNVYRCPGETFVYAFSEHFRRGTNEALHDYKTAVYLHDSRAICVLSLDLNDPKPTYITARQGIYELERPRLVQHNTKVSYFVHYPDSTSVFIHDVSTGELLKMVIVPGRHQGNHYIPYCEEGSNMLFSVASMRIHRVPIEGDLWISATANDLEHDYYVLHTQTQTFIYDTMTEKCVEMPRYVSSWGKKREAKNLPQKYSTQLLLGSNSYIWGDVSSFCIYNIQTGDILLEHSRRGRRKYWQRPQELFLVVNDFIVVDRDEIEIFFYDKADQTWKSSKEASPRVQQRLFRETFGSVLMAKYIWEYSTFNELDLNCLSWPFRQIVKEGYQRTLISFINDYIRRSTLIASLRKWLSYYYNKFISGDWEMEDLFKYD